jgi:hypothetical protein
VPFQAGGVDLCDPVLEGGAFDLISLAITENAFQGDELATGLVEIVVPPSTDSYLTQHIKVARSSQRTH